MVSVLSEFPSRVHSLNQSSCSGVKHCIISPLLGSWALTVLSPLGHSVLPECGLCPDPRPFAVDPRLSAKEEVLGVWDRTMRTTLGRQTPPRPCGSQKGPPFTIWGISMLQGPNHGTLRGTPPLLSVGQGRGTNSLDSGMPASLLQAPDAFEFLWLLEQALRVKGCDLNPALGLCYQNGCVVSRKSQLLRLRWFPHLQRAEEDLPHRTTVWPKRYLCVQAAGT